MRMEEKQIDERIRGSGRLSSRSSEKIQGNQEKKQLEKLVL